MVIITAAESKRKTKLIELKKKQEVEQKKNQWNFN